MCTLKVVCNRRNEESLELTKDLGGASVVYTFFSIAGDEKPAGEPFVNGLAMWQAQDRRERREDDEAAAIQARYEEEVLSS